MTSRIPGTNQQSKPQPDSVGRNPGSTNLTGEASPPDISSDQFDSLEQEKLKAEIDEIRLRIREQSSGKWQWAKATIKYLAIIIPLAVALGGLLIQWNQYEDQRERLAQFKVGPEVIELATQLNNTSDMNQQSLAAHQLAWFGRPAVFLLFEQLATQKRPTVRNAIVLALADIARSDKGKPSIMALLLQSTDAYVNLALSSGKDSELRRIEDRLTALAYVAAALQSDENDRTSSKEFLDFLRSVRKNIQSRPNLRLSTDKKKQLLDIVDHNLQAASGRPGVQ